MLEHNMTSLGLTGGSKLIVEKFYSASIPKDKREEAFDWLVDNNHGDLIKNQVATSFVRGQEQMARDLVEELTQRDMAVSNRKWVEPMTLKAWVKDELKEGKNIPSDLFGIFIGERAKIIKPKQ